MKSGSVSIADFAFMRSQSVALPYAGDQLNEELIAGLKHIERRHQDTCSVTFDVPCLLSLYRMSNQFHPPSSKALKGKVIILTGVCYIFLHVVTATDPSLIM